MKNKLKLSTNFTSRTKILPRLLTLIFFFAIFSITNLELTKAANGNDIKFKLQLDELPDSKIEAIGRACDNLHVVNYNKIKYKKIKLHSDYTLDFLCTEIEKIKAIKASEAREAAIKTLEIISKLNQLNGELPRYEQHHNGLPALPALPQPHDYNPYDYNPYDYNPYDYNPYGY